MFNSFKKWVKNEDLQRQAPPSGMQTMKTDLQRKFAKGVQYNLKIVIRGDRNTGKTCLWHRLQGQKFVEEYLPTAEIKVASIHWNYKATDDIVKVDVWDIVDQGKNKKSEGLKLENTNEADNDILGTPVLDASFLDVYKGAHAVIMLFDITKKWTFSYIERELPKVPYHLPVLVLANFRDMADHRVIITDEVEALIKSLDRPPGSPSIMFSECSMKNGFGLRFIHKFFNLPFLLNQRESLLKQLETNHLDLESCVEELDSEDHGYNQFLQMLADRKQGKHVQSPPKPPQSSVSPSPQERSSTPPQQKTQRPSPPTSLNTSKDKPTMQNTETPDKGALFSPSQMEDQRPSSKPEPEKKGFMSRFFRRSSSTPEPAAQVQQPVTGPNAPQQSRVTNVEEFVPEAGAVDDFLNEIPDATDKSSANYPLSSDDEENGGNPMVAGFQEDLDSDDQEPSYKVSTYSSSDSEEFSKVVISPRKSPPPTRVETSAPVELVKRVNLTEDNSESSSEEEAPTHEILQDADLPSDDDSYSKSSEKFDKLISESMVKKDALHADSTEAERRKRITEKEERTDEKSGESDDDFKENTMVSNTFDDVSSTDDAPLSTPAVSKHPIAIVTPLQATERRESSDEAVDIMGEKTSKSVGLNLELDAAALDFLEQRSSLSGKQSAVSNDNAGLSKDHRSSKKSSSQTKSKDEETEKKSSHRRHKHKKHRSKDVGDERSKGESSRSHRSRDEKERKKKKKYSKSSKTSALTEEEAAKNDLEAFLGGDSYEAF